MQIARPEVELLSNQISGRNHVTAFANAQGVILDAILDCDKDQLDWGRAIQPGSIWQESLRGTNALGLALHSGHPSVVSGPEHFFANHRGIHCVSVPVHASDGTLLGFLDASSNVAARHNHTMVLLSLAATTIENRHFAATHDQDLIVRFHPRRDYLNSQSAGLVAFNEAGTLQGLNKAATRLLSGLCARRGVGFGSVFDGSFSTFAHALRAERVAHLRDGFEASYFAKLHGPDRPALFAPPRQPNKKATGTADHKDASTPSPILDDDLVREGLRVMKSMLALDQPVCISGPPGSGKTTIAQYLHQTAAAKTPVISLDCRMLVDTDHAHSERMDQLFARLNERNLRRGGTVLFENISAFKEDIPSGFSMVLETLTRGAGAARWCVLATDSDTDKMFRSRRFGPIQFHVTRLPAVNGRTDLGKIVKAMLRQMLGHDQISTKAIAALAQRPMPENFWDLRHSLQVLAATYPTGVIRVEQIDRLFPQAGECEKVCAKCRGNAMKEKKCREIRRMYEICHGNVSLTARRLGVARNTVYLHLSDEE